MMIKCFFTLTIVLFLSACTMNDSIKPVETIRSDPSMTPMMTSTAVVTPQAQNGWKIISQSDVTIRPDLPPVHFVLSGQTNQWGTFDKDYPLERIEIVDAFSRGKIQEIAVEVSAVYDQGSGFEVEDMNFDGYQDFRILTALGAGGNSSFIYYFWDNKRGQFILNNDLEYVTSPVFHPKTRTIDSWEHCSASCFVKRNYEYLNHKLTLLIEEDVEYDEKSKLLNIIRTELVHGKYKVTKKKMDPELYDY